MISGPLSGGIPTRGRKRDHPDTEKENCDSNEEMVNCEKYGDNKQKLNDVLRTIFTTRHAEIKQLDEATKKANVNKFTLGWFSRCDGNTVTPDSKEGNTPLIQSSCV